MWSCIKPYFEVLIQASVLMAFNIDSTSCLFSWLTGTLLRSSQWPRLPGLQIENGSANTPSDFKRSSKSADQHGPKTLRETSTSEQLSGDECREAMSVMKHSADQPVVREKMKATFKHRQSMLHDPDQSSVILDHFPRFLDTPGLVRKTETSLMYQLLNVFCTMF